MKYWARGHWFMVGACVCLLACGDDDSDTSDAGPDGGGEQSACTVTVAPGSDDQDALQGALIDAESGDTVCLRKGRFKLTRQLTLSTERVTVRGEDGTVLDFSDQESGANGFEIGADHCTLESVRIENPTGDGVRATEVDYVTIRKVQVEWTRGPDPSNGGYGIYPVTSSHVLIEDCFASGASDTGIYVGQSHDIIIRDNEVTNNVAGIEIENSTDAEVYNNYAHGNTGGILVFNLPGLAVKDGKRAHVHDNRIEDNNLMNFGQPGNIIADVPPGTGIMVLAADDNELNNNTIKMHRSLGIAVVSFYVVLRDEEGMKDKDFDFFPERNYVHDNELSDNGSMPQGSAQTFGALVGISALPDLLWDGIVDTEKLDSAATGGDNHVPPESLRNCFNDNGDATFINLDLEHNGMHKSTDVTPYECTRPALQPIKF